jgi:CRP-like cAMP-binding protein
MKEGQKADTLYIIVKGIISIYKKIDYQDYSGDWHSKTRVLMVIDEA